jgi:hypothetical protein
MEKHEEILKELERKRKANNRHCELNDCPATPYMEGANRVLDEMIEFVKCLTNK